MGDRFCRGYSYSNRCMEDYNEEGEETEGEYEDEEVNDAENGEKSEELACPFCIEDFDVLGLCCHIDADHRVEVKPGFTKVEYSREEIDEVRSEVAECIQDHIYN